MSHLVSRLGSALVAFVLTAGLVVSSTPVEASAAGLKSRTVLRCTTRHHVRHCVRVAVHTATRTTKRNPVAHTPKPAPPTTPTSLPTGTTAPAGSLGGQ